MNYLTKHEYWYTCGSSFVNLVYNNLYDINEDKESDSHTDKKTGKLNIFGKIKYIVDRLEKFKLQSGKFSCLEKIPQEVLDDINNKKCLPKDSSLYRCIDEISKKKVLEKVNANNVYNEEFDITFCSWDEDDSKWKINKYKSSKNKIIFLKNKKIYYGNSYVKINLPFEYLTERIYDYLQKYVPIKTNEFFGFEFIGIVKLMEILALGTSLTSSEATLDFKILRRLCENYFLPDFKSFNKLVKNVKYLSQEDRIELQRLLYVSIINLERHCDYKCIDDLLKNESFNNIIHECTIIIDKSQDLLINDLVKSKQINDIPHIIKILKQIATLIIIPHDPLFH